MDCLVSPIYKEEKLSLMGSVCLIRSKRKILFMPYYIAQMLEIGGQLTSMKWIACSTPEFLGFIIGNYF